jgi:hypothetical protein
LKKVVAIFVLWHKFWIVEGLTEFGQCPQGWRNGPPKILSSEEIGFSGQFRQGRNTFALQIII